MPPRERAVDRGTRRGNALVAELGREIRQARIEHGLSQASVGRAAALSRAEVSRVERGLIRSASLLVLARLASVVGLELSARAYPTGSPIRDRAQLELVARLRQIVSPTFRWRAEVPVGPIGDLRAWDVVLSLGAELLGIEAETRLTDVQAVQRRIALKSRDSGISRAFLLLSNTRTNRLAVRAAQESLRDSFPTAAGDALRCLKEGRLPDSGACILI